MDSVTKDRVLFEIFNIEAKGFKSPTNKAIYIRSELEKFYGGSWTVIISPLVPDKHGYATGAYERGFLAIFEYDGYQYNIYKSKC